MSVVLLLDSLSYTSICARIIISVPFQQVDRAPNPETGTQRDDEGLKDPNSRVKKCHTMIFAADKRLSGHRVRQQRSFQKMMI